MHLGNNSCISLKPCGLGRPPQLTQLLLDLPNHRSTDGLYYRQWHTQSKIKTDPGTRKGPRANLLHDNLCQLANALP